jgi:hypothetical protein
MPPEKMFLVKGQAAHFHFLVTDKMAASKSIFEWTKQKEPDQDYMEDTSPQSSAGRGRRQCVDKHYCATLRHLSTVVLGIWFKLLVSTGPEAFCYNGHCLLLCPSLGSVPKIGHCTSQKSVNITFLADVEFRTPF